MRRPPTLALPGRAALLALLCSLLAGAAAHVSGVPLAWVLGPMVATAAFAMAGMEPVAPVAGRRFGQIVIGAAVGLNLTPLVLAHLAGWLPAMVATAYLAMLAGALAARGLARFSGVDLKTAYYAMMPGGLSEMANVGAQHGAQPEPIALVQALRVALVVCIMPILIVGLGMEGNFETLDRAADLPPLQLALLLGAGICGVMLVRLIRLDNPWVIGAIVGAAVLTATGTIEGRVPRGLFYLAQFLIGITIGARFRREVVVGLGRVTLVGSVFVVLLVAVLFGYAVLLAWWSGADIASAALASSPGGFPEMVATAEALHLNVALVTLFHVTRAFCVNSSTTRLWNLLLRVGFFGRTAR